MSFNISSPFYRKLHKNKKKMKLKIYTLALSMVAANPIGDWIPTLGKVSRLIYQLILNFGK